MMTGLSEHAPYVEIQDGDDLTPFVERQEKLEDLCGVKIGGISARKSSADRDGETRLRILAEVSSFIGHTLDRHLYIQAIIYDAAGRVVGQCTEAIYATGYRGLRAIDMTTFCRAEPARITLFPYQ
ncbi:hypothetical protein M5E06_17890 [Azospirillum sp. A1-3]|uniref:hypothetical protein n=1 Tax=Azospirillum sp. A1-3 TaxID=185874 RepID=UPI0020775DE7|nr:hypothetical protein [Azospirillum sp. A1-3]MCM8736008.1 hypothetical protein [Azospirillum sp. A1-3]